MSNSSSWQKQPKEYAELAITAVRKVVAAGRGMGMKTHAALDVYAPELELQPRRARRLFERDRDPIVTREECFRVTLLASRVLRSIADKLRDQADHWDQEADILELQQRQLSLWGGQECLSSGGALLPKRAA